MMAQLLAHLWGDYLLQSDWMALNKRKSGFACFCHAFFYSLCFLPLMWRPSVGFAWAAIFLSHFFIDHYGLARYLVWAKNWIAPLSRMETFVEAADRWRSFGKLPVAATKGDLDRVEADRRSITPNLSWSECSATGYAPCRPIWLSTWLLIIADNTLHLTCNYVALRWL